MQEEGKQKIEEGESGAERDFPEAAEDVRLPFRVGQEEWNLCLFSQVKVPLITFHFFNNNLTWNPK